MSAGEFQDHESVPDTLKGPPRRGPARSHQALLEEPSEQVLISMLICALRESAGLHPIPEPLPSARGALRPLPRAP